MSAITKADMDLMAEIKKDAAAFALLQAKCRWEQMPLYAVLEQWGDPRGWPDYKKDGAA